MKSVFTDEKNVIVYECEYISEEASIEIARQLTAESRGNITYHIEESPA